MTEEAQRRLARNENLFRETNEAIKRGQWPAEESKRVRFRCECARVDCNDAVEITLGEYERVRSDPRAFLLAPGHEITDIETVVNHEDGHLVVEKRGLAGAVAQALDPRR